MALMIPAQVILRADPCFLEQRTRVFREVHGEYPVGEQSAYRWLQATDAFDDRANKGRQGRRRAWANVVWAADALRHYPVLDLLCQVLHNSHKRAKRLYPDNADRQKVLASFPELFRLQTTEDGKHALLANSLRDWRLLFDPDDQEEEEHALWADIYRLILL